MALDQSQFRYSHFPHSLALVVHILTTPALNSSKPSSLNTGLAALLSKQHQQRIQTARGNILIRPPTAENQLHKYQKENALPKNPSSEGLPPLQGTVKPAPGAAELAKGPPLFTDQDEDLTMASKKLLSLREIEALGKESADKKSIWFKKDKWAQVLEQIKLLKSANSELGTANKSLTKQAKTLVTEKDKLAADYEELEANQRISSTRGRGKGAKKRNELKAEQREDINNQIKWYVKAVLFRTHKFVLPGKQLDAATKLVWAGIKDNMQLDKGPNALKESDFVEIYGSVVLSELSARRQYHQGRCWKMAALGTKFAYCFLFRLTLQLMGLTCLVVPPSNQTGLRPMTENCPLFSKLRTSGTFLSLPKALKIRILRPNKRRKTAKTALSTRNMRRQWSF